MKSYKYIKLSVGAGIEQAAYETRAEDNRQGILKHECNKYTHMWYCKDSNTYNVDKVIDREG